MSDTVNELLVNYWATGFFVIAALGLCAFMAGVSSLLGGRSHGVSKTIPFESGIVGVGDARQRFSVKFYLVAMLFVIFDVETIFMFPWAVNMDRLALFGLIEMLVFLFILVVGYLYAWRKGALEWA